MIQVGSCIRFPVLASFFKGNITYFQVCEKIVVFSLNKDKFRSFRYKFKFYLINNCIDL